MGHYKSNLRDIEFTLFEVLGRQDVLGVGPYADLDTDTTRSILAASLAGGSGFEPHEENPMIGFRGASRYYDQRYREGFALECRALKKVREDMGLTTGNDGNHLAPSFEAFLAEAATALESVDSVAGGALARHCSDERSRATGGLRR